MSPFSLSRQTTLQRAAPSADAPPPEPGADLTISIAFASDLPYERWWGIEILDCSPEAVRLDRLNDGAAILFNHNWDDLRGHHVPRSVVADGHVGHAIRGQHGRVERHGRDRQQQRRDHLPGQLRRLGQSASGALV